MNIVEYGWFDTTSQMRDEEYKTECLKATERIKETGSKYVIINTMDLKFLVGVDLQQWSVDVLVPKYIEMGIKKLVLIVPTDFLAQLSVKQTVNDIDKNKIEGMYEIKYFDNTEEV